MKFHLYIFTLFIVIILNACFFEQPVQDEKEDDQGIDYKSKTVNTVYDSTKNVYEYDTNGPTELTVNMDLQDSASDVYFVLTNTGYEKDRETPKLLSSTSSLTESKLSQSARTSNIPYRDRPTGIKGRPELDEFRKNPWDFISPRALFDTEIKRSSMTERSSSETLGDTISFYTDYYGNEQVNATLRKEVINIVDVTSDITLYVYVADDCWGESSEKSYFVTQDMVDALASSFLTEDSKNDIYHWVSNIYGEEWGEHSRSDVITDTNEITILLYDIDNDDIPNGAFTMGFYWPKDNFAQEYISGSNERIMFYIDAVVFACPDDDMKPKTPSTVWSIDSSYWPAEIISTLAHEFQHMIHFYQKNVRYGSESSTWFNEMCSMMAEDFVADKMLANGPRGVDYDDYTAGESGNKKGRLPYFNYYNDDSVLVWGPDGNELRSYSLNYALGSYLARNFEGVNFFRRIVQSSGFDAESIDMAFNDLGIDMTFKKALRKWGAAVILSNLTDVEQPYYSYNSGGPFTSSINSISYTIGSINMYNYDFDGDTGPYLYSNLESAGSAKRASNIYTKVATGVSNKQSWTVTLDQDVQLTIVIK